FPISLDRWLNSQANLDVGSTDPVRQWSFEGWTVKVFGDPTREPLRSNWPPEALVASQSPPQATDVWLILPSPMTVEDSALVAEVSLGAESHKILCRILNTQNAPELDYFSEPIPVCTIPRFNHDQAPWIAWQLQGAQKDPQPNPGWELLASVLDRLGIPPKLLCDDWIRQLQMWNLMDQQSELEKQLPSLAHRLIVSRSGLLLPLSGLKFTSATPIQKAIAQAPINTKSKRSTFKAWAGIALVMFTLGSIALAIRPTPIEPKKFSGSETQQGIAPKLLVDSRPKQTPSHDLPPEPLRVSDTPEESELTRTEFQSSENPATNLDSEPKSIESLVIHSLETNVRLASTQDPLPKPLEEKTEELPTPKPNQEQNDDQDQSMLVLSQASQKREFRVGRGFAAKKAKGIFTLNLDQGLEDKLHITGAMTQELTGESSGSWRIGMDDLEAELIVSIQSKPGPKWLVNYSVQIPSETGGPQVPLGPKDPAVVLSRLSQYNVWLQQTVDQLKFSASGTPKPGQPSPIQMARLYSAKQKDTERAIKRWRQIEQLAVVVFDSVRLKVELQPEPPAIDE
ncbi:MAG: hypothetical protein ACK480_01995, partial [Planctomycetota bacterium]